VQWKRGNQGMPHHSEGMDDDGWLWRKIGALRTPPVVAGEPRRRRTAGLRRRGQTLTRVRRRRRVRFSAVEMALRPAVSTRSGGGPAKELARADGGQRWRGATADNVAAEDGVLGLD
jgi:hypothetical protein